MRRGSLLIAAALTALGATVAWRALEFAREPDFDPGVTLTRRPRVRLEGVRFARPAGGGEITVRADRAEPGHRRLGHLAFGPSTHLVLENAVAEFRRPNGRGYRAAGRRAELTRDRLSFPGGGVLRPEGERPRRYGKIVVDLDSGRLAVD